MSAMADRIVACLNRARLPLEDEKLLQAAIAAELTAADIGHLREVLIAGGFIDFAVPTFPVPRVRPLPDLIGIEVKIKGSKRNIFRQLCGYCNEPRLRELIVATSLPLSLPPEISGKPVAIVDLGRAWL